MASARRLILPDDTSGGESNALSDERSGDASSGLRGGSSSVKRLAGESEFPPGNVKFAVAHKLRRRMHPGGTTHFYYCPSSAEKTNIPAAMVGEKYQFLWGKASRRAKTPPKYVTNLYATFTNAPKKISTCNKTSIAMNCRPLYLKMGH